MSHNAKCRSEFLVIDGKQICNIYEPDSTRIGCQFECISLSDGLAPPTELNIAELTSDRRGFMFVAFATALAKLVESLMWPGKFVLSSAVLTILQNRDVPNASTIKNWFAKYKSLPTVLRVNGVPVGSSGVRYFVRKSCLVQHHAISRSALYEPNEACVSLVKSAVHYVGKATLCEPVILTTPTVIPDLSIRSSHLVFFTPKDRCSLIAFSEKINRYMYGLRVRTSFDRGRPHKAPDLASNVGVEIKPLPPEPCKHGTVFPDAQMGSCNSDDPTTATPVLDKFATFDTQVDILLTPKDAKPLRNSIAIRSDEFEEEVIVWDPDPGECKSASLASFGEGTNMVAIHAQSKGAAFAYA